VLIRLFVLLGFFTLQSFGLAPKLEKQIFQLIDATQYSKHKRLIETIFADETPFFIDEHIDTIKLIETLKENGLLKLYHDAPLMNRVTFTTGGNAQFFVKLLRDTLQSIGYYRYFTRKAVRENSTFFWEIEFMSEYSIDPIVLQKALEKRNCSITTIERIDSSTWHYTIDITNAHLDLQKLQPHEPLELRKSLNAYWIDVSLGEKLTIQTLRGDSWFPDVALFDHKMHLLKSYKNEEKVSELVMYLPKETHYIKISDIFNQTNIKHGLKLLLEGAK